MPAKTDLSKELYLRFVGEQPMTKKRATKWIAITVVVLAVLGIGVKMLMPKHAEESGKAAVLTVETTPVKTITASRDLEISGSVWPSDPITIGSEVGGLRIETVQAEEGDFVRKGQVLATLNSSILRAQLAREEARLKSALANLNKAKQPNRSFEIIAIKAAFAQAKAVIAQEEWNIARAEANLNNARNFATRYTTLAKQGAISDQDADNKQAAQLMAEADLRNAQQRLDAAKQAASQAKQKMDMFVVGGRQEDIDTAAAAVDEIKANIQQIRSQIEQTIIRAPADGLVTKRDAHIGDIGTALQTRALFSMIRDNKLEVRAQVPEMDLVRLHEGQSVLFKGPDGKDFQGTIHIITPQVDPDTRLATLRIDIPFAKQFRPGIFVHGDVKLEPEQVNVIPTKAAVHRDDYTSVFTVEGDHVVAHSVKLGDRFGDDIEVVSGVKVGEPVVVMGAGFLKDGDVVRLAGQGRQ